MDKCKLKKIKDNLGVYITTGVFLIIGIVFLIIGYQDKILSWMKTTGIVVLVCIIPVILMIVHKEVLKKINRM